MGCNGICNNFKATKPSTGGRYEHGQKRCQTCEIFLYWNGVNCPCCNMRIRSTSRYVKSKEKAIPLVRM